MNRPGNRLVVVSNRVPAPSAAGAQVGGLAVALQSLMQQRGGLWFGWSGKISDSTSLRMIEDGAVRYATTDLTAEEHDGFYNEFSNATLWPLLHSMPELMTYDRRNAQVYREVNDRFADKLTPLLREGDMIWVHDYHLCALPAGLRSRGATGPIGFFLHIPFPGPDLLAKVPEATNLVRDLLAADLIGFQTENDARNFADAAVRLAGAEPAGGSFVLVAGRRVRIGAFPVGIEPQEFADTAHNAWEGASAQRLRRSLSGQALVLGVDRLDPTKGLMQRFSGFRRLLERSPDWRRRVTLLQIAAESRTDVAAYRDLRQAMEQEAGNINSGYAEPDWTPLRLIARAVPRDTIAGYMREARVGLVTPLRDGMNLVAKEYIAAQNPENPGVLILSRFAGAAEQLTSALLVNPYDADELADSLEQALTMDLAERQDRWQQSWGAIKDSSAVGWGRTFVAGLLRTTAPKRAMSGGEPATPHAGRESFASGVVRHL
ncbi:MAG: trehalose-6-phosphate synthase [Acetobacteraceae bacterium]|nr:trehalose-6-phosphate synthase [Acetobacteraceae bacterium]